jgi:hypothetical protein
MLAPEDNTTLINYKVTDAETQANSSTKICSHR